MHLWWDARCLGQLVINQKGAQSLQLRLAVLRPAVRATEVFLPHRCRSVAVGTQHNIVLLTNDSHCQTGRISEGREKRPFSFLKTLSIFFSLSSSAASQYSLKSFRGTSEAFVKCICTQRVIFWKTPSVFWFFSSSRRWNVQYMNTNRHPDVCKSHINTTFLML